MSNRKDISSYQPKIELFKKKKPSDVKDIYVSRVLTLPMEIPDKTKLHP